MTVGAAIVLGIVIGSMAWTIGFGLMGSLRRKKPRGVLVRITDGPDRNRACVVSLDGPASRLYIVDADDIVSAVVRPRLREYDTPLYLDDDGAVISIALSPEEHGEP